MGKGIANIILGDLGDLGEGKESETKFQCNFNCNLKNMERILFHYNSNDLFVLTKGQLR